MKILNLFKGNASKSIAPSQSTSNTVETTVAPSTQKERDSKDMENENKTQNETDASSAKTRIVHNLIILDESGSMHRIYQPALTGVNETLQTIRNAEKEHKNQKHFVSLIAFDSEHYNEIYKHTVAEKAIDITEEQYRPGGCTPLYDTMGRAITDLRKKVGKEDIVLVTIITDGYENASREFNGPAIKALVEAMKAEGWVFTYIGANQDVEAVSKSMSISNCLAFDANEDSTRKMFAKELKSRNNLYCKLSADFSKEELSEDYFIDID